MVVKKEEPKKYKTMLLYEGFKFANRAILEKYIMTIHAKTYEEARNISANVQTVEVEIVKRKTKKRR